jgi:DivIVA domain-containing protein
MFTFTPGWNTEGMEARHHRPVRHQGAVDRVRNVQFPLALRGYDRAAVDAHLAAIAQLVAELEATQLRENVVQRALDEVGEQTSSILQHAHDTAEEITARSRSQAEGRLQRAEREAEEIRREAEQYAERVANDTRRLTEERRRLIEELRTYAEAVLSVADDALERLPELLAERPEDTTQPTQQLPAAVPEPEPQAQPQPQPQPAAQPQPEPQPAPEPEPAPAPEPERIAAAEPPPSEPRFDDGVSEGVLRVERRPKGNSSS